MDAVDVPEAILKKLRKIALALPDAYEEQAWTGRRWMVRKKNFAHVFALDEGTKIAVVMAFRSEEPELTFLKNAGHPYFNLGWGRNVIGIVLDKATDWSEVAELVTDSFCVMAPKKLAVQVRGSSL